MRDIAKGFISINPQVIRENKNMFVQEYLIL